MSLRTGAVHPWHASCITVAMSIELNGIPAAVLMKRSGVSFFTRRVLQRWLRGEITTDAALELIGTQDAERIIDAWIQFRA